LEFHTIIFWEIRNNNLIFKKREFKSYKLRYKSLRFISILILVNMGFLNSLAKRIGRMYGTVSTVPTLVKEYTKAVIDKEGERFGRNAVSGALEKAQEPDSRQAISDLGGNVGRSAVISGYQEFQEPDVQETLRESADNLGRTAAQSAYRRLKQDDVQETIRETADYAIKPIKSTMTTFAIIGSLFLGGYLVYRFLSD
jgi:hypothetical protein